MTWVAFLFVVIFWIGASLNSRYGVCVEQMTIVPKEEYLAEAIMMASHQETATVRFEDHEAALGYFKENPSCCSKLEKEEIPDFDGALPGGWENGYTGFSIILPAEGAGQSSESLTHTTYVTLGRCLDVRSTYGVLE